jgi:hypothetical protein
MRALARTLSIPAIRLAMPVKLFAWRCRWKWLKRLILELTTAMDWAMVFADVQNEAMLLHFRVYKGNFIFGQAIMVVDHTAAKAQIEKPSLRGNRFMGVDIVSNDPAAFLTNAGPISTAPPTRDLVRRYIDEKIMTPEVRALDLSSLTSECKGILDEWASGAEMATMLKIRSAATRIFIKVLSGIDLAPQQADAITFSYVRRFSELSLFGRYLPSMLGILGTRQGIRRDAYLPLRRLGVDNLAIDMTLFAAMFSVGTIVIKSAGLAKANRIDYPALSMRERMAFVVEAVRLCPTVTSVHRILEETEQVAVAGTMLTADPGDEFAYPFVCINRDASVFSVPEAFRLHRPLEEVASVLSWSSGQHVCPAKDLSVLVTMMMLNALSSRFDFQQLTIYNLEF